MRGATGPARGEPVAWILRQPLAVRSTLRRWRGLLGMVVGVGVALGITLVLVALSRGVLALMTEDYLASGVDLYAVQRGGALLPVLPGDDPGTLRDARSLVARARVLPGVTEALGVMSWQVERTREGPRRDEAAELLAVVGVDGAPERIPGALVMRAGRWPRRGDEVVLGSKLAGDLGLGPGDAIVLEHRRFRVVGVGRLRGIGLGAFGANALAFMELRSLRDIAGLGDEVQYLLVDAADPGAVAARLDEEVGGIAASDRAAVLAAIDRVAEHDVVFMRTASALAAVVAGVFVASMLLRSVAERRSELATLRAVGVPDRALAGLVMGEALVVAAAATPLGLLIGHLLGGAINRLYAELVEVENVYRFDGWLGAGLFLLALLLSALAAAVPTWLALRVEPAELLRGA